MPLISIHCTSAGCLSSLSSMYGQSLQIFSFLLSFSIVMLLVIAGSDVDGDDNVVIGVEVLTGVVVILQLVLLSISLLYLVFPSLTQDDPFLLTVDVINSDDIPSMNYLVTKESIIRELDISVFYQRVTTGFRFSDPLTFPLSGWIFPGQFVCLILLIVLVILHLNLLDDNLSNISLVVVSMIQQLVLLFLTYLTSKDIGCCFAGVNVARWFPHTDRYTQLVQSCVRQGFSEIMRKRRGSCQWFNITLVTQTDDSAKKEVTRRHSDVTEIRKWFSGSEDEEDETINIEEQIKLLQTLLENIHDELYRSVMPLKTSGLTPIFFTRKEMAILDNYFINNAEMEKTAEQLIFQASP